LLKGVGDLTEGRTNIGFAAFLLKKKSPPMANPLRTKLRVVLRESRHPKPTPLSNG
jgi:hypothetical protein